MTRKMSSDGCFGGRMRKFQAVFLSLLVVAATYAARQSPSAPPRRGAAAKIKVVQLPDPATDSGVSVEQTLLALRSLQVPGNQRLDLPKVSQLAWAIQKATALDIASSAGPAAPGAELTGIRAFFVLPDGVHLYNPADHTLQQIDDGDERQALAAALLNQANAPIGGCQIVLAASPQDFSKRYGTRARTVMPLHVGQVARSLQLEAIAHGLTFVSIDSVDAAGVRRVIRMMRTLEPLFVAFVGYPAGQAPPSVSETGQTVQATALLVVPPQGFQDEELLATKRALEQAGVQVMVASTRMGTLMGMLNNAVRADVLLNQAKLDNFRAVVFIGGVGTLDYFNNPVVLNLVRQAATQRKVLAAIGTAPSILASAGVLKGARATAYISEQARLVQGGAMYTGSAVERDGLAITAVGAPAAPVFAQTIVQTLAETGPSSK